MAACLRIRRMLGAAVLAWMAQGLAAAQARPDPDAMLIAVYQALGSRHLRDAMEKVDALVAAYPNFQLGHLIRGDLLLMQTHQVDRLGAVEGAAADKLVSLRQEAAARLKALVERPDPELVPRAVLQLRDDQKRVLVVDASRSRLYLYENQGGQLRFARDFYISQGKLGVDKRREGDRKTPLGVYYITSRLAGTRLPAFYGAGALPISYPNEWDKLQGRDGSGIWLHGTPASNYSRPPLSSDGCVVLTNPDLNQLFAAVDVGKTPIVISRRLEFISRKQSQEERDGARALIESWRADLEGMDGDRLRRHYSAKFRGDHGQGVEGWLNRPEQRLSKKPVSIRDVSLFLYPGQDQLLVATFTQDAVIGRQHQALRRRQYWMREGGQWKIVSESSWQSVHRAPAADS
jgi:murein L,D-transpeptidase YafK